MGLSDPVARLKILVFLLACFPLLRLLILGVTGNLGTNPIEFITHSTGTWTLVGLMLTLTVTPLRQLTGISSLIRVRRMLGLFTFFYATLHFVTYIWLDQFFDLNAIIKDVYKRPFITVGFIAYLLLIPLAVTSSNAMIRRLGAKRWQWLHRAVYIIAILGVLHYWWLVKKDITRPLIYALVLSLLLGWRAVRRWRA
ncbi:MAG: protein-methionine-sulfoxide reductase heme-binding subunit MsrQ [Sulfuriferula sp.]